VVAADWSELTTHEEAGVLSMLEVVWLDSSVRLAAGWLEDELVPAAAAAVWRSLRRETGSDHLILWSLFQPNIINLIIFILGLGTVGQRENQKPSPCLVNYIKSKTEAQLSGDGRITN